MSDPASPGELGAFISYSRRDEMFVAELKSELEANGLTAWKDEDDIPPGAPWRTELGSAIEAALALVFVISPDSIASDECRKELERAIELGKRIVPVSWRPVEAMPESLGDVQHVRADRLDVGATAAAVVAAVTADPEWTRAHTYWTARAVRWEDPNRRGGLPSGRDLRDLREWLAKDDESREPRPSPVQRRFAAAAGRRARRIRRGGAAIAAAVVAIAGTLATLAIINHSDAVRAQDTAASRALARKSGVALSRDVDLAALLAVESSRKQPTDEARDALHAVLPLVAPMRHRLAGHTATVSAVAYSPDGTLLASGGDDSTVRLWTVAGRQRPAGEPIRTGSVVHDLAFSPRGDLLAAAEGNGNVSLWSVKGREQVALLKGHSDDAMSLAFNSDGTVLASASIDDTVRLWDVPGRRALGGPLPAKMGGALGVAFSPDDQLVAAGGLNGTIRLFDVANRKAVGRDLQQGGKDTGVYAIAFARDGISLFTAGANDVRRWDVESRRPLGKALNVGFASELAVSADGRSIATASDHAISLWDLGEDRPATRKFQGHTDDVADLAFSPDGAMLASGSRDRSVRLWDVSTPSLDQALAADKGDAVHRVAISADSKIVASANDRSVHLWDAIRRTEIKPPLVGHKETISSVALTPDGHTLLSGAMDGIIGIWSVAEHKVTGAIDCDCDQGVIALAVDPAGRIAASAGVDRKIRLWDLRTQKLIGRPIIAGDDFAWSLTFSPDGKTLAAGNFDKSLRLWDVATRQVIGTPIRGHADEVRAVAFSPDGRLLASGGRDQSVRLWDVAKRRQIGAPMARHRAIVTSVAFSPDGRTLASGSEDGAIRLWDVATRAPIGEPLTAAGTTVTDLAFSRDGKFLVSGTGDGVQFWSSVLWTRDLLAVRRFVCERIGRNLTRDEWADAMPGDDYRPTCALDSQARAPVNIRSVTTPKRTFVLAPGDSARIAQSSLVCGTGANGELACGFEVSDGSYPVGSVGIGMDDEKAIVVEQTATGPRLRKGYSFSSPSSGSAPQARLNGDKTFTLRVGDALSVGGTAIRCTVRGPGSVSCGIFLRGGEVPLTPVLELNRAGAKIIGVGPDGRHRQFYQRAHGIDGLL